MELFREDGHLTDRALEALVSGRELSEMDRLEMSEHLAFCDLCLSRYTQQLMDEGLMTPAHSCRDTIWWRIRRRAAPLGHRRRGHRPGGFAVELRRIRRHRGSERTPGKLGASRYQRKRTGTAGPLGPPDQRLFQRPGPGRQRRPGRQGTKRDEIFWRKRI